MRPEIVNIFGVPIHGYGLMIVCGFLLLVWVGGREVRRRGLPDRIADVCVVFLICGIVGGRTFYYFEFYSQEFANKPWYAFFAIWEGGLVFYGGAIGGLIGGAIFIVTQRLPVAEYFDVCALLAPIGMAFGRIGCFLQGCCYGRRCSADFPLAVQFPKDSPAAHFHRAQEWIGLEQAALPVHPVQLYQSAHDFLMFAAILAFYRLARPPRGAGMPLGLMLYAVGRFLIEGLRGDNPITPTGLTISQNVSIGVFLLGAALLLAVYTRASRPTPYPHRMTSSTG